MNEACEGFWECISPDAWLTGTGTLLGAFMGALLAGTFAVLAVKHQLEYDRTTRKYEEIESILKVSSIAKSKLDAFTIIAGVFETQLEKYKDEKISIEKMLSNIMSFNVGVETASQELQLLNYNVLPYEKHLEFINAVTTMKTIKETLDIIVLQEEQYQNLTDIYDDYFFTAFKSYTKEIARISPIIGGFITEKESELEDLKKQLK